MVRGHLEVVLGCSGRQEDPTTSIDGLSVSLLDLAFRGLAAGEEGEGEAPVLVTLGKRCGPVTWRLMWRPSRRFKCPAAPQGVGFPPLAERPISELGWLACWLV